MKGAGSNDKSAKVRLRCLNVGNNEKSYLAIIFFFIIISSRRIERRNKIRSGAVRLRTWSGGNFAENVKINCVLLY